MMSRRKKIWRGLALATAVVLMAEGVAKMPVRGASVNDVQQMEGTLSEPENEDTGENKDTGSAVKPDITKNLIPDTGKTGLGTDKTVVTGASETDTSVGTVPGNDNTDIGGTGDSDSNTVSGDRTGESSDSSNTNQMIDNGENSSTENNGQDSNTGSAVTPDENNKKETESGETDGDGSENGTNTPATGSGTEGDGNGDTDDGDENQGKFKVKIDGVEQTFNDFYEAWSKINEQTTIVLMDDVSVTAAENKACTLENGNVKLDLNGHRLEYTYPTSRSSSGTPDLIEIKGGTLTVTGEGTVSYNGNNNYSGACLYATGDAVLNIEGGTFSSNVSAPIYIDGATLNISGGTFSGAGSSGSAITINNGELKMTDGKVTRGSLTLYKKDGGLNVSLGVGSEFSEIKFMGTESGSVSEVLAPDCGFRSISSGNNWITDMDKLAGSSISNVRVDKKPIRSVTLSADPPVSEVQFSYNAGTEITLTAKVELVSGDPSEIREYEWYQIYNDGFEKKIEKTGDTYKFSTAGYDAGIYEYRVCVKSGDYEEWASFPLKINPLSPGVITNYNYQTEYTYGDFVAPPQNGIGSFYVDPAIPEGANVRWIYSWYKDSDDHMVNAPTDVGTYILRVEASDANYRAVGDIPVTITPRTVTPVLAGTTSKVYDGTTEAKGVEVKLDNVVPGDANGIGVKVDSIAYNDINARLANRIVASGIELTGNKAGNYILNSTQASVEASISKAQLLIQLDVSPNTEKINRPVRVTVTALNSDGSSMDNNWLKVEDVKLFVSGRNDLEEEHILPLKASSSRYGVYTADYTTNIKGDKTFTVEITGNANYEVSNIASDNTLTILEKTNAVMKLTADETEDIVYGDEVTYTAVVTKENENDMDVLSGMVQFYEDEIADDNKLGSAKTIAKSGDKVSITLDEDILTAGDHKILAVFSGSKSFEDVSGEVSTTVAKKQLTWDVSGLSASKAAGTSGEATVYGELKLDGLVDEGDVTIKQPGKLLTNGLKSAEAGSYKVTVVSEDKEWKFDPEEPKNYELPEGDPEITAKVNAVKELPNPPADTEDGTKFKLVMEEGISTVPEGLKNTSFNTPAKIEQELKRVLTESGVFKEENTAIYDVVLQVSTDEGKTWQVADYTNFPSGGLQVTLPYPGGTGRYTNNYAVAHMFSSSYFGKTSGQIEIPKVKKTDNGMEFTVTGLSPIGLAWGGPMDVINTVGNIIRASGATTWDNNPIMLYAGLAGGAALAIVVVITTCVVRSGKKKKKSRR